MTSHEIAKILLKHPDTVVEAMTPGYYGDFSFYEVEAVVMLSVYGRSKPTIRLTADKSVYYKDTILT